MFEAKNFYMMTQVKECSNIVQKYSDKKEITAHTRTKKPIEIAALREVNLGHQLMNQVSGAMVFASWASVFQDSREYQLLADSTTNYFPAEAVALRFKIGSTTMCRKREDIYISENLLYFCDSKSAYNQILDLTLTTYVKTAAKDTAKQRDRSESVYTIIFSIKAGNKTFSKTQFPTKKAIELTSKVIKRLHMAAPNDYHFIIDGMTSPYMKGQLQDSKKEEPEQRGWFRKTKNTGSKLKEQLPSPSQLLYGLDFVEKYPYYKIASKFIRFGTGSYQALWYVIKDSNTSNHVAVFENESDLSNSLKRHLYQTILCSTEEDCIEKIYAAIQKQ